MWSWQNCRTFYHTHCKSNAEFLENLDKIPKTSYADTTLGRGPVTNGDMVADRELESSLRLGRQHKIVDKYRNNKLVAFRSGSVESAFFLARRTDLELATHLNEHEGSAIRMNAGLYHVNPDDKADIETWWCDNFEELLKHEETEALSCYCGLNFDLPCWSALSLRKTYYNYSDMSRLILQNSEGKKLLYIGNGTTSIQKAFDKGIKNMWNFPVSNFELYCLHTPQTTSGCTPPHVHMKATVEALVKEIEEEYSDFDTAVLGCGAYGAPIMNYLRKKYSSKNLVYIGAECFKMFGVYSEGMPYTYYFEANKKNWIEVIEEPPPGSESHPEPKYWRKRNSPTD